MDKLVLYRKAYRLLKDITPLRFDCGVLCKSRCCSGGKDRGMHLYPGEDQFLKNKTGFLDTRNEEFGASTIRFAVCRGKCKRDLRPLACRVFPLVPYISSDGKLHVIEDPRASYNCPVLYCSDSFHISALFRRKVYEVSQLLIQDPDIREYLLSLSEVLREYTLFTGSKLPG